jgi:hypothetical protein
MISNTIYGVETNTNIIWALTLNLKVLVKGNFYFVLMINSTLVN